MPELVSVVVPAYKNTDYLGATITSILAQTDPDFELIIADHSSPDGTRQVAESFDDPRITVVDTPAGGGAPRNWNRVSKLATGAYVKLVCGDDLIHPEAIAEQRAALDAHPGAVIAACKRDLVDARGKTFVKARGLHGLSGLVRGAEAVRATVRAGTNIFGEPACAMIRRSALEETGWWDGTKAYYIDAGTYARVLTQGDLVAVPTSLAAFRVSASQWSVRLMKEQQQQAAEFHAEARTLFPDTITEGDVRRGDLLAHVVAWQRRAAYLVLGKRMRPEA